MAPHLQGKRPGDNLSAYALHPAAAAVGLGSSPLAAADLSAAYRKVTASLERQDQLSTMEAVGGGDRREDAAQPRQQQRPSVDAAFRLVVSARRLRYRRHLPIHLGSPFGRLCTEMPFSLSTCRCRRVLCMCMSVSADTQAADSGSDQLGRENAAHAALPRLPGAVTIPTSRRARMGARK
ncbi:unnamed protein product [Schistocephalus solidus]|uniref:Uncharacterized protein n=1 Tax=Schistocephalus solidus TaxID=70667 RepID=A0A183TQW0_SCHSO|nr:unnamed protein product [Schistocephalus solidus]